MQKQYVAKPQKVMAEQWSAALTPPPVGVCTEAHPVGTCIQTPIFADWRAHVHTETGLWELHDGDWITFSVAFPTHPPEVVTNEAFVELYGTQGPPLPEGS